MFTKYGLPVLALAALSFAVFHVVRAQQVPPKLEPPVQPARSPFGKGVARAGIVEPNTEIINLGSHLSGVVDEVHVAVNGRVYKGQALFRIDARAQKAEVAYREAALESAKRQLEKLRQMPRPEELPAMKARLAEAKATLADRKDLLDRVARLARTGTVSDEERVRSEQSYHVALHQVRRADADLKLMEAGAWKPDLAVATANVKMAEAQLEQARTELDRLTVTAPVDGTVLQVNVRRGEYVNGQMGKSMIVLGNVDPLHVRVDIDENDIPRFDEKSAAKAMLRGDPRQEFKLEFVRIEPYVVPKKSLTGDNTERVDTRVLQVIYRVVPGQKPLYVGQQVDVYVEGATPARSG
jgi:multidrug resistance efflux pump